MTRITDHNDEEANQAVEEFRTFFVEFAEKISDIPEFKEQENKLKKYGIRIVQINAQLYRDTRAKTTH